MRWRESERGSSGLVLDLIKLVLTSYDAHLPHAAVVYRLTPIVTGRGWGGVQSQAATSMWPYL